MLTSELKDTRTTIAGDLITMAKLDIDFFMALEHMPYSPDLQPSNFSPVSATKKCTERITVCEHQGNHDKGHKSTERGMEKWFTGMLAKSFTNVSKNVSLPKGTTSEETSFKWM